MDYYNYHRRKSSTVHIGETPLGSEYPIRIQSMTNTSTLDTQGSVEQCIRIIEAGADYVRLTAQGVREAENLGEIKHELVARGFRTPLIADIHFNPKAADAAACTVEKVRINPGNFVDSARTFKQLSYTDDEYAGELKRLRERFVAFLNICKEHHTAIRLGVNHGSLSDRIMSRYGDTPEGMVESCMEFLRICREENFHDVVISIKASNTVVMVQTVRLLIKTMDAEGMNYPLHLGVTEAGDGEDGRIKSAVGIGTLLADGIGDTIRVSLSEAPEAEVPVARKLVDYITSRTDHTPITAPHLSLEQIAFRAKEHCEGIGAGQQPIVIAVGMPAGNTKADFYYTGNQPADRTRSIVDYAHYCGQANSYPLFRANEWNALKEVDAPVRFLQIDTTELSEQLLAGIAHEKGLMLILSSQHPNKSRSRFRAFPARQPRRWHIPPQRRESIGREPHRPYVHHFASRPQAVQQNRIHILPQLRTNHVRPANDNRPGKSGNLAPHRLENRNHGLYRKRARRNGRRRLWICRRRTESGKPVQRERVYRKKYS